MTAREELAAAALDCAPFTTALLDSDGEIIWVNEAWRAFGRANGFDHPRDGIGLNYLDVTEAAVEDDHARRAAEGLYAVLDGEQSTFSMEYPCHSPDERRWFLMHATLVDGLHSPVASDEGEMTPETVCLVTHQDVSDPVERELLAQQQREELERLAGMLSHDVRNPLAVARGWSGYLAQHEAYDADAVAAIDDALVRIGGIVEDAVVLIRSGLEVTETESCSLASVAREAWQTVATSDETLVVEDDCTFDIPAGLFRSVLENLLRNAVEHGSVDDSPVDDSTAQSSRSVEIRVGTLPDKDGFFVEDDGPGIPTELRDQVFDLGFSTDESSGFGLAIVEQVASLYGWSVTVTDADSGGARFEIQTESGCSDI